MNEYETRSQIIYISSIYQTISEVVSFIKCKSSEKISSWIPAFVQESASSREEGWYVCLEGTQEERV